MNNYKGDIDTNRTDSFSSLYVIISKIGLGCITYFMVGLLISLIYVLSDMDYFTLNGQFRNQRFFTDDGYYYTKQLVIIYGLFAFILTMFIGPVGIIPCIIWSWLLTISYISMSVYMNSTNPDKYNKLLIRFIGFVSFVSHSLLCNFIFYLFYPMNSMFSSYIYDYDIKLTNSNNSNNKHNINSTHNNSRSSYTFYRIISFMGGYFIGCSLLSFVLSIKTDMRDSLYPINNHNNNMKLLFAMLIASSISMLTSLLLSFQFVYEYIIKIKLLYKIGNTNDTNSNYNSNITNSHNDLIDKSRYMLDSGTFVWFPINKHTNNVISKNFHTIIDIEMLFVWILNPFIITLIPYTIPSHFQFRKQSYIHKLLFSLIFIIIFMFLNEDLIFSYLFPNEYMNSSVFNIIYSNQYIQLKDDHLYLNPISLSNNGNIDCINTNFYKTYFNNNISSIQNSHSTFVPYPHFDDIWDYVDNENVLLSSYIEQIIKLFYISDKSLVDINSYTYYFYSINSFSFNEYKDRNQEEAGVYSYNEHNYNMMTVSLNPIDNLSYEISNTSDILIKLKKFYYIYHHYPFLLKLFSSDVLIGPDTIKHIINNSTSSIVSGFKSTYRLVLTNQEGILNVQFIQSNFINKSESRGVYSLVLRVLSRTTLNEQKILISLLHKYVEKALKTLNVLEISEFCNCLTKIKPFYDIGFNTLLSYTPNVSNSYYSFDKIMTNKIGNHICLCYVIMYILNPVILISLGFLVDLILDMIYISNKKFGKNTYSYGRVQLLIKFILMLFDILEEIVNLMKNRILGFLFSKCFCIKHYDAYYFYFVDITIYICSFFEFIFKIDDESIDKYTKNISNLLSLIKYTKHDIGPNKSPVVDIKAYECICKVIISETCSCKCKKSERNKCCCIICRNYEIICLTICFGCQVCCICCHKQCPCHTNTSEHCRYDTYPKTITVQSPVYQLGTGFLNWVLPFMGLKVTPTQIFAITTPKDVTQCPCQQICSFINCIKKCTESNGCEEICNKIKGLFNCSLECKQNEDKCICQKICDKIHELNTKSKGSLEEIKKKIQAKIKCDDCKKCCCNIVLISVYCLYKASKCISYYLYNQATLQCLNCCKQIENKRIIYLNTINMNYENILITSKNNRICDTMCNMIPKTNCINENDNMSIGQNLSNDHTNNSIKQNGHKLKQSRIIISLGLIFLILCIRMSFDISNDDNKHIHKTNNKLMGQHIQNNNLVGSMYNIFVNNNINDYALNRNGGYGTNTNNSNIKQNKMIYFLNMLVSLISALYMNMVIRNMYDKLKLEYDIWSYLINMILMTGMMSSLLTKYSVHIFDFVGVLDKYGMNLSKDGILLNVVEGNKIIDDVNAPVKNMMMFGLFKSMTKDLSSLLRYKDKTSSNISGSKTTYSKMKNKLYPYKDMSKPIHRITKYCDKCQHSLCKIHKSVINNFGNEKSIDIVSVLDFLSYTMIHNQMTFINQYESYFSGDELYMVWKLNKFVNNNVFVTEYYRHQTLNKIESDIKQLINGDNKLGSYNLMLLWEIFGENEIRNITLKSMSDINDKQMIQNQRDILLSVLYDEYLSDFLKFEKYVCNTYLNTRLVTKSESLNVNNITEFTNILNKHILDKSTIQHLANIYSKNTHNRIIKSLMLPTVRCNITGTKDKVSKNIKSYCNDWLKNKLLFCKHMKSPYCEEAVNIAYNTIVDLVDKPGNLYQQILDLLTNIDLSELNTLFEQSYHYSRKLIKPICKDCESMSLYYINQYLSESLVNIDRMLRPLGMYLSWNGTPILSQHLYKYGHKY